MNTAGLSPPRILGAHPKAVGNIGTRSESIPTLPRRRRGMQLGEPTTDYESIADHRSQTNRSSRYSSFAIATIVAATLIFFAQREHELSALRAENAQLRSARVPSATIVATTAKAEAAATKTAESAVMTASTAAEGMAATAAAEICTCEDAEKSPLLLEYAYRSGLCPGAPENLGPSFATEDCLEDINAEYNFEGDFNGARPVLFDASTAHEFEVFHGVRFARLPAGEVTRQWECSEATGCHDCDPLNQPHQCTASRGFAMLWVPEGATADTPRLLYVHGGSWLTGSPVSASYAPFCAMIAKMSGYPVLAIDYPLAPIGTFETILAEVGKSVHWLATHDPAQLVHMGGAGGLVENADAARTPLESAPMLFISGDSSGGGTATSALLAQSSPDGLPNAGAATISGGVLFSPWLNLRCDTPSYVSQVRSE